MPGRTTPALWWRPRRSNPPHRSERKRCKPAASPPRVHDEQELTARLASFLLGVIVQCRVRGRPHNSHRRIYQRSGCRRSQCTPNSSYHPPSTLRSEKTARKVQTLSAKTSRIGRIGYFKKSHRAQWRARCRIHCKITGLGCRLAIVRGSSHESRLEDERSPFPTLAQ